MHIQKKQKLWLVLGKHHKTLEKVEHLKLLFKDLQYFPVSTIKASVCKM